MIESDGYLKESFGVAVFRHSTLVGMIGGEHKEGMVEPGFGSNGVKERTQGMVGVTDRLMDG